MTALHESDAAFCPTHMACKICDVVLESPELEIGEQASCPVCNTFITEAISNSFQKGMAFSVTALLLLLSTFYFPLIGISRSGQEKSMTLLDSGISLVANNETVLGWLVIFFIIILPAVLLLLLFTVLLSLSLRVYHRANYWMTRSYYALREWNMVEVYVVGLLVSITKIATLARVELGLSFWALLLFSIFFLAAHYSVDKVHVWQSVKELTPQ